MPAKNALVATIIIVLNAQMDTDKTQLIHKRAPKSVLRHVQQEQICAMMECV